MVAKYSYTEITFVLFPPKAQIALLSGIGRTVTLLQIPLSVKSAQHSAERR